MPWLDKSGICAAPPVSGVPQGRHAAV